MYSQLDYEIKIIGLRTRVVVDSTISIVILFKEEKKTEYQLLEFKVNVFERDVDDEILEEISLSLMEQFDNFFDIKADRVPKKVSSCGKGLSSEIGSFLIQIAPAILPALIVFMQHWVGTARKVTFETPNGTKAEFTAEKRYSKEDIIELIEKVNQIAVAGQ